MNSMQGGWGFQDRHDWVISWLSILVVALLVLYGVIFLILQFRGPSKPVAGRPTPAPSRTLPTQPQTQRPTRVIPTRSGQLPRPTSSGIRANPPTPSASTRPTFPSARPTEVPTRVASLPPPTRIPTPPTPTQRVVATPVPTPSRAALPTRLPPPTPSRSPEPSLLPLPTPTRRGPPVPQGEPHYLRVGPAFRRGDQAMQQGRGTGLDFTLTQTSNGIRVDVGPFPSQIAAVQAMGRLRRELADDEVPIVLVPMSRIREATPDSRPAVPERVTPVAPTRTPPRPGAPSDLDNLPATLTVAEATSLLRSRFSWSPRRSPGQHTVQVSSFRSMANALRFRDTLRGEGFDAYLDLTELSGLAWFRVMVGNYADPARAKEISTQVQGRHPEVGRTLVRKL